MSSLGAGRTWRRGAGARREGSNSTEERFPLPVQPSGEATVCFFCFVFCFLCVNSSGLKISALTQHQLIRFHGRARENVEYVARWRDFSCVVRVKRLSSRRGGV